MRHVRKSFGDAVRKRRVQLGLSQEKLAFRCGSHRNYIGEIERGEKSPSLHTIFAVAEGLDMTASALMKMTEDFVLKSALEPGDKAD